MKSDASCTFQLMHHLYDTPFTCVHSAIVSISEGLPCQAGGKVRKLVWLMASAADGGSGPCTGAESRRLCAVELNQKLLALAPDPRKVTLSAARKVQVLGSGVSVDEVLHCLELCSSNLEAIDMEMVQDCSDPASVDKLLAGVAEALGRLPLQQLCLRWISPSADGFAHLATGLASACASLQHVELERCKLRDWSLFSESLASCRGLVSLNVSHNPLRAAGVAGVLRSITGLSVQVLNLEACGIGKKSLDALEGAVAEWAAAEAQHPRLQELNVSGNQLGHAGTQCVAGLLSSCTALQRLHWRSNSMGAEGAAALAARLDACSSLACLDIGGNKLGPEQVDHVIAALAEGVSLTALDVSNNPCGDEGVEILLKHVALLESARDLNLARCRLTASGAGRLSDLLSRTPGLHALSLADNKLLSDEGLGDACQAIAKMGSLERLDFSACGLSAASSPHMQEILRCCVSLKTLHVQANKDLGRSSVDSIESACEIVH